MKRKIWIVIALMIIPVAAFAQTGKRFNAYTTITESGLADADLWQVWNGGNIKNISTQNLWDYLVGTKTISSFTGTTIPDASTVIASLQALETALELKQAGDADLTYLAGVTLSDDAKGLITAANYAAMIELLGAGPTDNPSFNSLNVSGGNLAAANKQVVKDWAASLPYVANVTAVVHGGKLWICKSSHTASVTDEPGVGVNSGTYWTEANSYAQITGVTGNSKYLGTDAGGTYGIFDLPSGGSMTWPSAGGIPLYSGSSSWGTSLSSSTALHYLRRNATNDAYEFGALPSFLASADIDTSSELRTILSDESGTGALIFANGALGTPSFTALNMPSGDASPSTTAGQIKHDTDTTGLTGGAVAWWNGSAVKYLVDLDTLPSNDDYVVAYDADNDKFYMKVDANTGGLSDIDDLPGDSVDDDKIDIGLLAALTGTTSTTFQLDNDASGPLLKWDSGNTQLAIRNAANDAYYDLRVKNLYAENINSTKADGEYFANFDNTVAITFTPALGDIYSRTTTGTSVLYFYDGTASRVILNDNSTLDDDKVSFDDADGLWTAQTIGAALEELNDSINTGIPNSSTAKVHWSQLAGVPAGFLDGTDDGGGFSPLTYDDLTWGAAAGGSQTWTWDTGSGTDPNMVVSDSYFTFNKIIQCAGIETTRSATVGGSVRIGYEGSNNGDNYIDVKAPDSRSTSLTLLYPTADPSAGQVLSFSAPSTGVSTGTWITPVTEGTATGGILFGDSSPDTAGEFGYASNQFSVHDGTASRDVLQVASTTITKTEYIPIAYAEDGSVAPSASAVTASTRKVRTREFSGTADNDVEIHWMVPADYSGGVKFRFVGYVTNATAPADTEVMAFSLAGCSNGNSDVLGCTVGTAQTSSLTADANYVQYDRLSGAYSSAITITNIAAGESAHLKLTRLATTTDTYGRAFGLAGIEIKYQAKVNASGDY